MRAYIVVNGSNDLYKPLKDSVDVLLRNFKKYDELEIILAFSLMDMKNLDIHSEVTSTYLGYYKLKNKKVEKLPYKFKTIETSLDVDKFLAESFDKEYEGESILIVSGHGGPFQSLLDMSISPAKSKSTFEFCSSIKKYKFKLVFLDMCAVNYIEVIYEILEESNIEAILTYKSLAPFKEVDYLEILNSINKKKFQLGVLNSELPFVYFDKESLILIKYIIEIKNILVKKIFNGNIDINKAIKKILRYTSIVGEESDGAIIMKTDNLNFIKYELEDNVDRAIYSRYLYSGICDWSKIVADNISINDNYKYITLSMDSVKDIISLHNPSFDRMKIDDAFNTYVNMRKEREFYK